MPAGCFQLFGEPPRHIGVHGRGRNKNGVASERLGDAVLAEQDGLRLRSIDDHADDDAGALGRFRRAFAAFAAGLEERASGGRRAVAADNIQPARLSDVAMPKPIEPSPITATGGFTISGISAFPRSFLVNLIPA